VFAVASIVWYFNNT